MTISIILADDHHLVRQGLALLLRAERDFRLVGEAGDGHEALRAVAEHRPDILVVDLMIPGPSGIEVTRHVRANHPATQVVVLSMHANEPFVLEALAAGALGYVLKCAEPGELVRAVRAVHAGRRYLSPPLSERALEQYRRRLETRARRPLHALSRREREVLRLVAEGLSNAEVAARLGIGERTVEVHRAHLMAKLGLHTQAQLIRYALRHGITAL
jgi:DNA-binding NarL/FixJ family response regulator